MKAKSIFSTVSASLVLMASLTACSPTTSPLEADPTSPSQTSEAPSQAPVTPDATTTPEAPVEPSTEPVKPAPAAGTALEALSALKVQDAYSGSADYERDAFGNGWLEPSDTVNRPEVSSLKNTREVILYRDMQDTTISNGKVTSGKFPDPYSGAVIKFNSEGGQGGGVDIDHVVALSAGWATGAADWDTSKREAFANDPLNLLASDAGENRGKGDKDASEYLPPNPAFQCEYIARQVAVKVKYAAWVTPAEKGAMENVLNTCPDEPIAVDISSPTKAGQVVVGGAVAEAPADTPAPAPVVPAPVDGATEPDYGSCSKAKEAGASTPYQQGVNPEYDFYNDGDGDGLVCE